MTTRRRSRETRGASNAFGDALPNTPRQIDQEIFGFGDDSQYVTAEPLDIFEVYPDLTQPRRAVPSAVRLKWNGQPETIRDMLAYWWELANAERGAETDLFSLLGKSQSVDLSDDAGPFEKSLVELISLAGTIHRDTLLNPISVVRIGSHYRIETGERRWLAYHLLDWFTENEEHRPYQKIPARIMEKANVFRQAAENNARQNLNAIARARQYAILMMELWRSDENRTVQFYSPERFNEDVGFYAQAKDLDAPYGKGEIIRQAMGITTRQQMSRYRDLLQLPEPIWLGGDDRNMSLNELLEFVDMEMGAALQKFESSLASDDLEAQAPPTLSREKPSIVEKLAKSAFSMRVSAQKAAKKKNPEVREQLRQVAQDQVEWWRKFRESLDLTE